MTTPRVKTLPAVPDDVLGRRHHRDCMVTSELRMRVVQAGARGGSVKWGLLKMCPYANSRCYRACTLEFRNCIYDSEKRKVCP